MPTNRISIAALCNDSQPRTPPSGPYLPPSATRRPSDSSSSDASSSGRSGSSSGSNASVAPLLHHGSPSLSPPRTRKTAAAYDPIRDADNRHDDDDPQSTRPISSLSFSPSPPPPPPSTYIRKPPLAPTHPGPLFTPIAPRLHPASTPVSRNPPPNANAPSARPSQQQQTTRLLAIPSVARYTPYPLQPTKHTIAYSNQVSPSSRTDLPNNGPIAFEFYDPNNAAGSSNSRRSSKPKANQPASASMSAHPKKSKSKSKVAVVGQEGASNTSGRVTLGSNIRRELIPNMAARSTSPSASGSRSGRRPPAPGAASNANSSTMDGALDVEMELLQALGAHEDTRADPASLVARGSPVKLEPQTTTAEDDLLEEVEAMERATAHKPTRQTPFMSSPMKHHQPEEGDAMEIDLKQRSTLSPSPAILQPAKLPSRTSPHTAPTPIAISAAHSQPTSASQSLRPTPSPARTPTIAAASLPAPLPPAPATTSSSTKRGPSRSAAGGAAKASPATSKSRTAKATAARKKQTAHELLKVGSAKPKGASGGGGGGPASAGGGGAFAFHGTSSGRAAAAAASASFGAALDADDAYEDQRDGAEYRPDAAKGQGGEDESEEEVDMRLYCVCRQLYDDRFMLGCENCDDWFHPICIGLEEYQCDLLEHFYCEPCQRADSNLKIVWRHRCANGLRHPASNSSDACWRAAHPPMSKYCSKECGIEAMERRLLPYAKQKAGLRLEGDERDEGVKREMKRLFAGVRERKRREAVVLRVDDGTGAGASAARDGGVGDNRGMVIPPGMVVHPPGSRLASDLAALQHDLAETRGELQMRTRELALILARARLVRLAVSWSDRPENAQRCCFDARMLMDGVEWEEWVEGEGRAMLEGVTDDGPTAPPLGQGPPRHAMAAAAAAAAVAAAVVVNGREQEGRTTPLPEGEESGLEEEMGVEDEDSPWCDGRRKCERHAGWQKLQVAECDLNRGIKELIISRLKDREEHLRVRLKCASAAVEISEQGRKAAEKDSDSVMLDVV